MLLPLSEILPKRSGGGGRSHEDGDGGVSTKPTARVARAVTEMMRPALLARPLPPLPPESPRESEAAEPGPSPLGAPPPDPDPEAAGATDARTDASAPPSAAGGANAAAPTVVPLAAGETDRGADAGADEGGGCDERGNGCVEPAPSACHFDEAVEMRNPVHDDDDDR